MAFNEFSSNKYRDITGRFLQIEIIASKCQTFGYNEHLLTTCSFFCTFLLVNWTRFNKSFTVTRYRSWTDSGVTNSSQTGISVFTSRPFHRCECPFWSRPPLISSLQRSESTHSVKYSEVTKFRHDLSYIRRTEEHIS